MLKSCMPRTHTPSRQDTCSQNASLLLLIFKDAGRLFDSVPLSLLCVRKQRSLFWNMHLKSADESPQSANVSPQSANMLPQSANMLAKSANVSPQCANNLRTCRPNLRTIWRRPNLRTLCDHVAPSRKRPVFASCKSANTSSLPISEQNTKGYPISAESILLGKL